MIDHICPCCGKAEPEVSFGKCRKKKHGKQTYCKPCLKKKNAAHYILHKPRKLADRKRYRENNPDKVKLTKRKSHLKYSYGLTLEEYQSGCQRQNNLCKICGDFSERLVVDHNHSTGKFRGLICGRCNRALGFLQDSVEILKSAIEYLLA